MRPFLGIRIDYEAENITTDTWRELTPLMPGSSQKALIFDSSGETMELGIGPEGSEQHLLYLNPGGNGSIDLTITSKTRLSLRAVSANATKGELLIDFSKK